MAIFEYKGINKKGRNIRGTIDADSSRAARLKLKKDGIYVIDLKNKKTAKSKKGKKQSRQKKVGVEDLSLMTRQLATLIKSSVPLVEALTAISEQVENPTLKSAMADVKDMVNEGSTMAKSLSKYPNIFTNIYISMVEAGEMSGSLDVILLRLAEFTEAESDLNAKIKSAMIYPVIMLIFTMGMLGVLFIYVIPKITSIFEQAEMKLPWYSQLVIDFSGFLVNYWMAILIAGFVSFMLFKSWKSTPKGSDSWDAMVLKFPIVGKLARMIAVSRFTRTLSTLLTGGVPMLSAMEIVSRVVDNAVLSKAVSQARDNISEGESIAAPLKKSEEFPPIVIHMISIGEKTGELENMLSHVSDSYDFQVKNQVQGLTSLMEPIMIIVMGGVVGVIVFAILVPIFNMSNLAG